MLSRLSIRISPYLLATALLASCGSEATPPASPVAAEPPEPEDAGAGETADDEASETASPGSARPRFVDDPRGGVRLTSDDAEASALGRGARSAPLVVDAGHEESADEDPAAPGPDRGARTLRIERRGIYVTRGDEERLLVGPAELRTGARQLGSSRAVAERRSEDRFELERGDQIVEWYVPLDGGVEQGWTIAERPGSEGLEVRLAIGDEVALSPEPDEHGHIELELLGAGLRYGALHVTDSEGATVPATIRVERRAILIEIDDSSATYPLTIDPLVVWSYAAVDLPNDGSYGALFGSTSAVSGTIAVIGEPDQPSATGVSSGAVQIYSGATGPWLHNRTVRMTTSEGGSQQFGRSVDVAGNVYVVGAPGANSGRGAFYFVDHSQGYLTTGVPNYYLTRPSPEATNGLGFGYQIAISGSRIVVASNPLFGKVFIFNRSGVLINQDGSTLTGTGMFGNSIDIDPQDPNLVVVGAPTAETTGRVYVYRRGTSAWALEATIAPPGIYSKFGMSVAVSNGRIAIAAMAGNAAELILATKSGSTWSATSVLTSSGRLSADRSIQYGAPDRQPWVALSPDGTIRLLGFPNASATGASGEPVYGYLNATGPSGLSWTANPGTYVRTRGMSVATDGRTVLVGYQSLGAGAVRAYDLRLSNGSGCTSASQCGSGFCVDGVCCNTACNLTCDSCSYSAGGTTDGTCTPVRSGVTRVCRASPGACDVTETCLPSSTACPEDVFAPSWQVCRGSQGICDSAEYCTGESAGCPLNVYRPSSVECRAATDLCDMPEFCTGSSSACPASTGAVRPSTETCRGSTGPCDPAENCTGSSAACPADQLAAAGTECNASSGGGCDPAEVCDGQTADCPSPRYSPGCRSRRVTRHSRRARRVEPRADVAGA